ncbi:MAG: aspartate-semialdehyde dehydrogenase [Gammaproteobacteria bacterium]|nr:aspartate-semialdehyde dehydrogenase [Gammaproteobacteria bacterium]MDE2345297.1 aspartate-semialdehyde dehydrogenase [Gammaproteobacteria bacterium]
MATFDIAVVGATGTVGSCMLEILEERKFPVGKLYALASGRSTEKHAIFNTSHVQVQDLANFDFAKVKIALFSAGAAVSAQYAPQAVASGCVVIDNTSQFRYQADVPLVVPEVNPQDLAQYKQRGIVANPNCSTIQMVVALKPLYDAAGIERINVATYQSVSGAGADAIEELASQTAELLNGRPPSLGGVFAKQIAFNALPQIDEFQENGYTREEMKMLWETRKILGDDAIQVNATAVRVPVFYGHSEVLHIETRRKLSAERARELLRGAPGVVLLDERRPGGYPTAVTEAAHQDAVFVGRIREDLSHYRGLDLWVVADNVRKGAALNSVQVAELLVKTYL